MSIIKTEKGREIALSPSEFDEFNEKYISLAWLLCSSTALTRGYCKVLDAYRTLKLLTQEEGIAALDDGTTLDQAPVFKGITLYEADIKRILGVERLINNTTRHENAELKARAEAAVIYLAQLIPAEMRDIAPGR